MKSTGCVLCERAYINSTPPSNMEDRSRHNNACTNSNITYTKQESGLQAATFNGSSSLIDCGSGAALDTPKTFSVAMWIKRVTTTGYYQVIGYTTTDNMDWTIRGVTSLNTAQFIFKDSGGTERDSTSTSVIPTSWGLMVWTWDGTYIRTYLNGALDKTSTDYSATPPRSTAAYNLYIGGTLTGYTNVWFNGQIALTRMFDRVLSPSEIRRIFSAEGRWFSV